jgi:hypothetical protein
MRRRGVTTERKKRRGLDAKRLMGGEIMRKRNKKITRRKGEGQRRVKLEIRQGINWMKREKEQEKKLRKVRIDNYRKKRWITEGDRQEREREREREREILLQIKIMCKCVDTRGRLSDSYHIL